MAFIILYLVCCLIVIPALAIRIMFCRPLEDLQEDSVSDYFGNMYNLVKMKSRWTATYMLVSTVRRALFCVIMFFVRHPTIQIILLSYLNIAHVIYMGWLMPRSIRMLNYIELVNEFFIHM